MNVTEEIQRFIGLLVVGERGAKLTEDQTVEAIDALYGSWQAETRPDPNGTPHLMLGPLIVDHLKVAQDLLYQLTDATGRPTTEIVGDLARRAARRVGGAD